MKATKIAKIFSIFIFFFLIASIFFIGANMILYKQRMDNFRSFDLDELKRKEFIIQTIEFKKFIVQGTEVQKPSKFSKYTDEVQVFHVSGKAQVIFTDIDSLKINEADSDYSRKILRLDYEKKSGSVPFRIKILISENDIQKVAHFESEEFSFLGFKKDLIKPDMSQAEIISVVKKNLADEFYSQVVKEFSSGGESEVYRTFIAQLSKAIKSVSDWESVEVQVVPGIPALGGV
ncbi:MAG: hypothetical protein IJP61_03640 [Treponema sp.]|nr:hypothetical protein [Treponema sp.]